HQKRNTVHAPNNRAVRQDLGDAVHLVPSPFRMRPASGDWVAFVEHVADLVRTRGYGLVVFDALPALWPVANENDAAQVLEALTPMRAITEAGAALLLVNHPRKGDATEAQSSRGSGALPGWVDIIVEMRRHRPEDRADRRRVLSAYSRFEDTPVEAVLELRDDGYAYIGDLAMLNEEERKRTIAKVLRDSDGALTVQEVKSRWPPQMVPGEATLRADLQAGAASGLWMRTGAGKRNDPHRFHSPSELDSRTPPVIGGGIESAASPRGGEGGRP
ncbi:MAG TPA: AAA family ATPase, partial [Phycisphaerales bacterium]|nr:AAA family ATPase [Phycisphaerales bacterium]